MSIARFALEMHQFRWVASWLRGGPREGRQRMIRTPVTSPPLLWSAYVRLDQEDSCTGRRWNEMRLRHGTVATAIVFFTSFLSLSWYTAWQNGKGTEISSIHSYFAYVTPSSSQAMFKGNFGLVLMFEIPAGNVIFNSGSFELMHSWTVCIRVG